MGLDDDIFEDDGKPVNRRECSLLRQAINTRVGGIEKDIQEIKYEQKIMKECFDRFATAQEGNWSKLYIIVVVILILVAAGRLFDFDAWLGLVP